MKNVFTELEFWKEHCLTYHYFGEWTQQYKYTEKEIKTKLEEEETDYKQYVLHNLRQAIQEAEEFGLVKTEDDSLITGAKIVVSGAVVLTKE